VTSISTYRACGIAATSLILSLARPSFASGSLLYLEAQGVAGYSSHGRDAEFYSMHEDDPMQKPGPGLDFLQRISGETGDILTLAVQARLAFNGSERKHYYLEPQLYNAYLKFKLPGFDLWMGHSRPALGMSSYFDSHALLLPTLAMEGLGFDRDWGAGLTAQFEGGEFGVSATTGTGMPLRIGGTYLVSSRIALGVPAADNFTVGLSGSVGMIPASGDADAMEEFAAGGIDFAFLWNNFDLRGDLIAGMKDGHPAAGAMVRLGMFLLEEERLKLEVQPAYLLRIGRSTYQAAGGITYRITQYLTARGMYLYDSGMGDHRIVFQLYLYWRV
jgi:hypothetical protein